MSPENHWLEDVFPIEIVLFRGHVSFRGCSFQKTPQKKHHGINIIYIVYINM